MTRKECLDKAAECVLQNRQDQYGDAEDCFKKIARLWNAYLPSTIELEPFDVACMMALLKIARIQANPKHGDSWVDLAGYAACGADIAVPEPFRYDKPKAEGGCCQKGSDRPEFKPGDKVLVTMPEGEDVPCVYVGESTHPGCCCVRYLSGDNSGDTDDTVPIDQLRRVPVSKAEGCEELVQKDAPQTPRELYDRIIANNPATYGRARKPTGEELAEMAEEEWHG